MVSALPCPSFLGFGREPFTVAREGVARGSWVGCAVHTDLIVLRADHRCYKRLLRGGPNTALNKDVRTTERCARHTLQDYKTGRWNSISEAGWEQARAKSWKTSPRKI